MHDPSTAAAIAIAAILRRNHGGDPDITAAHILTALRGHGWRPTAAQAPPEIPAGRPLAPERVTAIAAQARQAITKGPST